MEYKEERYSDIIGELDTLLPTFFAEVDIYPDYQEPDINHELLSSIPDLQVVTARCEDNLVGFHIAIIQKDIFYKTLTLGNVLFYYLLPKYRGGGNGTKMFEYAERLYKSKGVQRVFMSRKVYINNEKLFRDLCYTLIEENYTKRIQ